MILEWSLRFAEGRRGKEEQVIEGGRRGAEEHGPQLCLDLSAVPFTLASKCYSTS